MNVAGCSAVLDALLPLAHSEILRTAPAIMTDTNLCKWGEKNLLERTAVNVSCRSSIPAPPGMSELL